MTSGPVAVMRIDPANGNRTVLSGCVDAACTSIAGTGPSLSRPQSGFVQADGSLLVTDFGLASVFRVDPTTGNRTVLSSSSTGTGPTFEFPIGLTLPEPGTIPALAASLALLVLLARQRAPRRM